jgi:hypothetical protein
LRSASARARLLPGLDFREIAWAELGPLREQITPVGGDRHLIAFPFAQAEIPVRRPLAADAT